MRSRRSAGQLRSGDRSDASARADVAAAPALQRHDVTHAYDEPRRQALHLLRHHRQPPVVRAAIPLAHRTPTRCSRCASRSMRSQDAVAAVRRGLRDRGLVAILLTLLLAIPLAGTLVSRLQRLRQAALQLAIGGNVADFPADRARDEVGDLARSFSIMQRRLRQQEEARRAFVATASHELRTPLASLDGMLELLADDLQAERAGSGGRGRAARPRAGRSRAGSRGWPPTCSISAGSTPRSACARSRSSSASSAAPCWPSSSFPAPAAGSASCSRTTARRPGRSPIPAASPASCGSCSTTRCAWPRATARSR